MKNIGKFFLLYTLIRTPPSWILTVLVAFILAPIFLFQELSRELQYLPHEIQQKVELYWGNDDSTSP